VGDLNIKDGVMLYASTMALNIRDLSEDFSMGVGTLGANPPRI
jgi:hypothetical protein